MRKLYLLTLSLLFIFSTAVNASESGVANITGATAKANIQISGGLNSKHGKFDGNVTISSDKAVMSDTNVKGSITMKSEESKPVLELRCGTRVTGGITFEGEPGIVRISEDSVVKGEVSNGSVEAIEDIEDKDCQPAEVKKK